MSFNVRDNRKKGWFRIDNEYLNGMGKYVGPIGISIYVSLCRHADLDTQKAFPAQKLIAKEIGVTERTVRKYIEFLEKLNVIAITRDKNVQNKWQNNVYWLLDKNEWRNPEEFVSAGNPEETVSGPRGNCFTTQRKQFPPKETQGKETQGKETIEKQSFSGQKINEVIDLWKNINPSYDRWFGNTTQRKAVDYLLNKLGEDKLRQIIQEILPVANTEQFAPTITTPHQLAEKLGNLAAWTQKQKNNPPNIVSV